MTVPIVAFFPALLVGSALFDLKTRHIPDALTLGGAMVLVAMCFLVSPRNGLLSLSASLLAFLVFLAVRILTHGKLGGGDAKLSMLVGAALGIVGWYIAVCVSVAAALVYALATKKHRQAIVFGPFMALGGLGALGAALLLPALPLRPF